MDLRDLHLTHLLTNFEIQIIIKMNLELMGFILEIKDGAYVINLDECSDIGTHWIALYVNTKTVTYFDSFRVEHIPKEIKKFISNKIIIANLFRIQAYDSVMCGYFCVGFIEGNNLTDFTNLSSPNNFKQNDDIILNYFLTNV